MRQTKTYNLFSAHHFSLIYKHSSHLKNLTFSHTTALPIGPRIDHAFSGFGAIFYYKKSIALTGVIQWVGITLKTKRLLVQFLVRAHAWVVGQVPGWRQMIDVSLPH